MNYTLENLRDMIPLYINGRLSESEKKDFETALGKHPELSRELIEFKEINEGYKDIKQDAPSSSNDLYPRIIENIKKQKPKALLSAAPGLINQILRTLKSVFGSPQLSWSVVAVQLFVIISLLIFYPTDNKFKTLSENHIAEDSGMINVVFKEDAKEKDMRRLIEGVNGSIISGPTPDGLYIIKIKNINDIEIVLTGLKNSDIVRLAVKRY